MPRYKVPGKILLASSIPKKLSGKIDKEKIMELLEKSIAPL
jgi:non-ribosomal peptide synthetase component E (peptide arylation enzyme)